MTTFYDTTYPNEVVLTSEQEAIVADIRRIIGDYPELVYDAYGYVNSDDEAFSSKVFRQGTIYRFDEKSWPLKVTVSGTDYTDLNDPTVNNYELLIFSSAALNEPTFEIFYKSFDYSDREIVEAYDQALIVLVGLSIPATSIPVNLRTLQAAILLLESSFGVNNEGSFKVIDGRSEFQKTSGRGQEASFLDSLRKELDKMMLNIRFHISLNLEGIRLE